MIATCFDSYEAISLGWTQLYNQLIRWSRVLPEETNGYSVCR
jgi:hypothetical protein